MTNLLIQQQQRLPLLVQTLEVFGLLLLDLLCKLHRELSLWLFIFLYFAIYVHAVGNCDVTELIWRVLGHNLKNAWVDIKGLLWVTRLVFVGWLCPYGPFTPLEGVGRRIGRRACHSRHLRASCRRRIPTDAGFGL
jgi:hypothetical protein